MPPLTGATQWFDSPAEQRDAARKSGAGTSIDSIDVQFVRYQNELSDCIIGRRKKQTSPVCIIMHVLKDKLFCTINESNAYREPLCIAFLDGADRWSVELINA